MSVLDDETDMELTEPPNDGEPRKEEIPKEPIVKTGTPGTSGQPSTGKVVTTKNTSMDIAERL